MKTLTFEKNLSQVRENETKTFTIQITRMSGDRMKVVVTETCGNVQWLFIVTEPNDCVVLNIEMKTFDFQKILSQVGRNESRNFNVYITRTDQNEIVVTLMEEIGAVQWLRVITEPNDCVILNIETKERN